MYNSARVFNQKTRQQRKGDYGQQVSTQTKYGLVTKGGFTYQKSPTWDLASKDVDKFITEKGSQQEKLKMFKSILRQKIVNGKQQTKSYNLNQIADFLPWVFSTQFLFEPFRSILYCLKTGIDPINALAVVSTITSELINNVADQAIFQSVKYQSPYVQTAKAIFLQNGVGVKTGLYAVSIDYLANHMEYLAMTFQKAKTKGNEIATNMIKSFAQFAATFMGEKAVDWFVSLGTDVSSLKQWREAKYADKTTQKWKMTIGNMISYMFKHLRPYGKIIINFGYLQHCAQTKVIGGKQFYYFWDHPQILISCRQSIAQVYLSIDGNLKLIPEQSFDIDFLRQIVLNDVIKMGGRLFKQLTIQTTRTKQEKQVYDEFADKYLTWKDNKPAKTANQKALVQAMTTMMAQIKQKNLKKQKKKQ